MTTYWIGNGVLSARIADYGATLVDLRLAGWVHPLVLGLECEVDYADSDHYAGAVIGRFANRIGGGRAVIDDKNLMLPTNSGGHHLHGGETGFSRQVWTVVSHDADQITMTLRSPDGHEGYPGNCDVTVIYAITAPATLTLSFSAVPDAKTLINICHHPYFNFAGSGPLTAHALKIAADHVLPSGDDLIPTGEKRNVADTQFDFREERQLDDGRPEPGYNNTYCLANHSRDEPQFAAELSLPGGPRMELWTTQPGLHLYDGYKLAENLRGLEGRQYGPRQGLCLEAQGWPDSPNHPHFPSAIVEGGQTYKQRTEYRFAPLAARLSA
jgi:aldose 1-epimerase